MTIKQKQCLLAYLGHYQGAIDGLWGSQSRAATLEFQKQHGLTPNGSFEEATKKKILECICQEEDEDDGWQEIRFFTREEFACKCGRCGGYPAQMNRTLLRVADRLREHFGSPVTVSSGLRCAAHNANVGGVRNSRHLMGNAMDFCVAGKTAAAVLNFVQRQPEIRYCYAIDGRYVHMDVA